jgi:hypothetical protein
MQVKSNSLLPEHVRASRFPVISVRNIDEKREALYVSVYYPPLKFTNPTDGARHEKIFLPVSDDSVSFRAFRERRRALAAVE